MGAARKKAEGVARRRAEYLAAWGAIEKGTSLTMATIPWPCAAPSVAGEGITVAQVAEVVLRRKLRRRLVVQVV